MSILHPSLWLGTHPGGVKPKPERTSIRIDGKMLAVEDYSTGNIRMYAS
jgi:hypothetical protein